MISNGNHRTNDQWCWIIFRYPLLWKDWCWSSVCITDEAIRSDSVLPPSGKGILAKSSVCKSAAGFSYSTSEYLRIHLLWLFSTDCNPPQLSWELEHLPKQAWASCTCEICWCETTSQRPLLQTCLKMVQTLTSCVEYKLWAVPSSNVLLPKEHQGLLHFCAWQMGLPQTLGWTGFIDRIKIN
jgi:hypothetical protein